MAAWHGIKTHNGLKALHLDDHFGSGNKKSPGCDPGAKIERLPTKYKAAQKWNAHKKLGQVFLCPCHLSIYDAGGKVLDGPVGGTQGGEGTASSSWRASPTAWPMAGKTGTAQVRGKADTSLFAGWGPAVGGFPPQYAVAVVIPEAGFGGDVSAPLAFRILAPASKGWLPAACPVAALARGATACCRAPGLWGGRRAPWCTRLRDR